MPQRIVSSGIRLYFTLLYPQCTFTRLILISKLFKSLSGNDLPFFTHGKLSPDVDLNSFEIKILYIYIHDSFKENFNIEIRSHLSAIHR